jgi:cytidine deaminase
MILQPKDAEIVVGIVARIGVDTKAVVKSVSEELVKYGYSVEEIHVTDLLKGFSSKLNLIPNPTYERYESYIEACNELRRDTGDEVMASLAITEISQRRQERDVTENVQVRNAFIVNQIKRPEEFELFRSIYGEHYVQISCHAEEERRIEILTSKISDDHPENPKDSDWNIKARSLVNADDSQETEKHGQRLRKVFPLSDIIVDANSNHSADKAIERFFRALFGDNSVTPTKEEYGMELANTAAQRSSDISRQVGAAILSSDSEIRAIGCNEVPKAGGGTYWEDDAHDSREFTLGQDSNEKRRQAVLLDLMFRLRTAKALKAELSADGEIYKFLFERTDSLISDSQLMDSLEYGRSVHAEMNAITDAARGGHPIKNCLLFTNTFPCHNCAKHIVASGISQVIYIHPYPKSYAKELFSDSISVNPSIRDNNRVVFRQFIGILGPMYARVFTKARWKSERGKIEAFARKSASFIRRTPIPSYIETEKHLLYELKIRLTAKGYLDVPNQPALPI